MRFISCFAGMGGFDAGLELAGMWCVLQIEKDKHCQRVLEHHWPGVERLDDITKADCRGRTADLVCGGFPCQDLSVAGNRAGLAGTRSGLFFQLLRVIGEVAPRWVLIENVPGLLSSNCGRDFGVVVSSLVQFGYGLAWRVLDSQYFGLAQRRQRVFIVGCLGDAASAAKILFESESVSWDSPPSREAGTGVAGTITGGVAGGSGHGKKSGTDREGFLVASPITSGYAKGPGVNDGKKGSPQNLIVYGGNDTRGPRAAAALNAGGSGRIDFESENFVVAATLNSGGNSGGFRTEPGEHLVAHTLRAECHDASEDGTGRGVPLVAYQCHGTNVGPMGTLRKGNGGLTGGAPFTVENRQGVRRLTPLECLRLQGFPDDYLDIEGLSDSAKYRMLGNAVSVPVIEWIGNRLTQPAVHAT